MDKNKIGCRNISQLLIYSLFLKAPSLPPIAAPPVNANHVRKGGELLHSLPV